MKTIRISFLLIICLFTTLQLLAQTASLSGRVTDADTNEALARATVQLYRIGKDTTFVGGSYSNAQGQFTLNGAAGSYMLRISFLGYKPVEQHIRLTAG